MALSSSFESLYSPSPCSSININISSSYRLLQLDWCFMCKKSLAVGADDIYMYRGDTPFCSEDCRQEQIDIDVDAEERRVKQQRRRLRRQQQKENSTDKSSFRFEAEEKEKIMLRAPSAGAVAASS